MIFKLSGTTNAVAGKQFADFVQTNRSLVQKIFLCGMSLGISIGIATRMLIHGVFQSH